MKSRKMPVGLFCGLLLFLISCGSGGATGNPEPVLETGIPAALTEAKLVYEGPGGIYLQFPGEKASLIAEGGKWPRWSPDGSWIAFLKGKQVLRLDTESGKVHPLADTSTPKTLAVSPTGKEVWFSEGRKVKAVDIQSRDVRVLAEDGEFLEIDSGPEGNTLVATVKSFGYKVKVFDLVSGEIRSLGKGCSASLSPDGKQATNNLDGHKELALVKIEDGSRIKTLPAPKGSLTDNQFWSNHPDWVVSIDEEHGAVFAHRVSDGKVWQLSGGPKADRPDLWVP